MADAPKKDDKPKGSSLEGIEFIFIALIILGAVSTIGPAIKMFFEEGDITFFGINLTELWGSSSWLLEVLKIFGYIAAGMAAVGTFVWNRRADSLWDEHRKKLYPEDIHLAEGKISVPEINPTIEKWNDITEKVESPVESNWRLAIIEADIILDELLDKLNLPGDTIGEKLKAVEKSDFTTIEQAWEAHKARNNIAHQGGFLLNQREARRIISLYEVVFKEFSII